MATSLLSDTEKAELVTAFADLVETFVRPLVAYQEAEKIVLISDPKYNRLNRINQTNLTPQYSSIAQIINARILYEKNMSVYFGDLSKSRQEGTQNKIPMTDGIVRIKVDADGFAFIGRAKRVELDGNMFEIITVESPHGLFGAEYYTYWLKRFQ